MTREQRSIALVMLICLVYGLSFWFSSGIFILPTPLFPLFALISGVYICILNFQSDRLISSFIITSLFIEFVLSPFFITLIVSEEKFEQFEHSLWPDFGRILSFFLFFLSGTLFTLKEKTRQSKWFSAVFMLTFVASMITNSAGLYCFSISSILLFSKYNKMIRFPLQYIALLLVLLRSAEWIFLSFAV